MNRFGLLAALLATVACTSKSSISQTKDGGMVSSFPGATGGTTGTGGQDAAGSGADGGAGDAGRGGGGSGAGGSTGIGGVGETGGTGGRGSGGASSTGGTGGAGGMDGGGVVDSGTGGSPLTDCKGLICASDLQILTVTSPALGTTQCACVPISSTGHCMSCACGDPLCAPFFARCLGFSLEAGLLCARTADKDTPGPAGRCRGPLPVSTAQGSHS